MIIYKMTLKFEGHDEERTRYIVARCIDDAIEFAEKQWVPLERPPIVEYVDIAHIAPESPLPSDSVYTHLIQNLKDVLEYDAGYEEESIESLAFLCHHAFVRISRLQAELNGEWSPEEATERLQNDSSIQE
jgi:hypothetical protein